MSAATGVKYTGELLRWHPLLMDPSLGTGFLLNASISAPLFFIVIIIIYVFSSTGLKCYGGSIFCATVRLFTWDAQVSLDMETLKRVLKYTIF